MADFNTGTLKGSIKIDFGSVLKAEKAVKSLQGEFSAYTKAASKAASSEKARVRALGQVESNLKKLNATQKNQVNATKKSNAAISKAVSATKSYQAVVEGYGASSLEAVEAQVRMKNSIEDANRSVREATNNAKAQVAAHRENVRATREVTTATRNNSNATGTATLNVKQYEAAMTRAVKAKTQILIAERNSAAATVQGEKALDRARKTLENYNKLLNKGTASANELAIAQGKLSRDIENARVTTTGLNGATANARSWFRSSRAAASQFGLQLQDVAVQAQMGTNWLVIMGQQGSQLLGFFGAAGAAAGAFLAIGAALAYVASNSKVAKDSAKQLQEVVDDLDSSFQDASTGAEILSDKILDLAEVSKASAEFELKRQLAELNKEIESVGNSLQAAIGVQDQFLSAGVEQTRNLMRSGMDAADIYNALVGGVENASVSMQTALSAVSAASKQATQDLGLTSNEAISLFTAINNVDVDPTEESLQQLLDTLRFLDFASVDANANFTALSVELSELATTAVRAIRRGEDIEGTLANLSEALDRARDSTKNNNNVTETAADKAQEYIESLREEAVTLGMSEKALARYRILKLAAQDDSIKNVQALLDESDALIEARQNRQKYMDAEEEAQKKREQYKEWVKDLKSSIDPMIKFRKEAEKIWEAYERGSLDGISKEQVKEYIESLRPAAEEFENQFSSAAENVSSALQDAIASGDWDGLSDAIGNTLATGIAGIVETSITNSLVDSVSKSSGMLSQIGAAFAGPFAGAIAGGVAQVAFQEIADMFSGSDWDPTEARQAAQGTGTVLGSIDAKSESIANAIEDVSGTNEQLVNINSGMLRALNSLQAGISGAAARVARQAGGVGFSTQDAYSRNQLAASTLAGVGGGVAGLTVGAGIAGALGTSLSYGGMAALGGGIGLATGGIGLLVAPLIDSLLGGIVDEAVGFLDDLTGGLLSDIGGAVFGGGQEVKDTGIRIVGGRINDLINDTLVQAYAEIEEDGGLFGSDDRWTELQSLPDDVSRQFSLVFGDIADSVIEGASALNMAPADIQSSLDNFVVKTQKLSLEGLDADEQAAEIQAYFGTIFDNLAGSVVPFLDEFQNSGEGLGETLARISTQARLFDEALITIGSAFEYTLDAYNRADVANSLTELFGGIEEFANVITGFEDNFLSEAEQFENAGRRLTEALGSLPLPQTREGFVNLVRAQDLTTASGREAYVSLLRLQDQADEYYSFLEDRAEELNSVLKSASDDALKDLKDAVARRIAVLQEEFDARMKANQLATDAAREGLQAIEEELRKIRSATAQLRGQYDPIQETLRQNALNTIRAALRTGDLTGSGEAAEVASAVDQSGFETRQAFEKEQAKTLYILSQLEEEGDKQLTVAERSLLQLQKQSEMIRQQFEAEKARLQQMVTDAENQLNALRGIETAVLSVEEAVRAMKASIGSERRGTGVTPSSARESAILGLYSEIGRSANEVTQAELDYWRQGGLSGDVLRDTFMQAAREDGNLPGFASGGIHSGGLRIVGENGPELEATGPSRIYSNSQTQSLLSNTELVNEVRKLREEISIMKSSSVKTARNTSKTSKQLERWDIEGLPKERVFT